MSRMQLSQAVKRAVGAATLALGLAAAATGTVAQTTRPAQPAPAPAAPAPAPAQGQQPAPGPVKVDLIPSPADWTKVCGKEPGGKEICFTTRDFGTTPNEPPVLALAVYDVKGDDQRMVRLLMPIGLMLRPGFRFSVDKGASLEGTFEICMPNGCFAESKVKGLTIDSLKKGTTLFVTAKNSVNNEVTFTIPLAGFGRAFDGAAIDPKVLEEQQKKLQEELQKRADEERKRLEGNPTPASPQASVPAPPKP